MKGEAWLACEWRCEGGEDVQDRGLVVAVQGVQGMVAEGVECRPRMCVTARVEHDSADQKEY